VALSLIFFVKNINHFGSVSRQIKVYLFSIFFFILLPSILSGSIANSLKYVIQYFCYFITFFAFVAFSKQNNFSKLILYFKIILVEILLFVILQFLIGIEFNFYGTYNPNFYDLDNFRYYSFFQDPQIFGQFAGMFSLLFLYFSHYTNNRKYLFLYILVILLVIISGSKSPLIGLAVATLFYFLRQNFLTTLIFVLLLLIGFEQLSSLASNLVIFKRFEVFEDQSENRLLFWNDGIKVLLNNVMGIGFGNYKSEVAKYSPEAYFTIDNEIVYPGHPENGYLTLLVNSGLIGSILLFFTFFRLFFIPSHDKSNLKFLVKLILLVFAISFFSTYTLDDVKIGIFLTVIISMIYDQ